MAKVRAGQSQNQNLFLGLERRALVVLSCLNPVMKLSMLSRLPAALLLAVARDSLEEG